MRLGSLSARLLFGFVAIAAAFGMAALLGGGEANAGTNCTAGDNHRVEHVRGSSQCIANAGPGSRATARDTSGNGAAVAVSTTGGTATAENNGNNSSALASGARRGHGYAVTKGPFSTAVAQGRDGGNAYAVAGAAGGAFATYDGVVCLGSMSAAYDTTTNRGCLKWGLINIR